jgi:hypothetical protein
MERISELGTTLAVTSTLRRNTNYMERISELGTTLAVTRSLNIRSVFQLLATANVLPSSMIEAIYSSETPVLVRATRRHISEYGILRAPGLLICTTLLIFHLPKYRQEIRQIFLMKE